MGVINCSASLSTIGIGSCPCGPQGYQIPVSGQIQVDFNASSASWTNSQRTFVRNACCNVTCDAFCEGQPAACQEGGTMLQGISAPTSGSKRPPLPPKDVSRKRNASGMRSAIGGRGPCNCKIEYETSSGAQITVTGKKQCGDTCCGRCKGQVGAIAPSQDGMKKATGSRVSTYWGGLKIK